LIHQEIKKIIIFHCGVSNTSAVRIHMYCGPRGLHHCTNRPVSAVVSRRCSKHVMTLVSDTGFRIVDVGQD
jgi:hypothetical protein